jgi:hypothetical protein
LIGGVLRRVFDQLSRLDRISWQNFKMPPRQEQTRIRSMHRAIVESKVRVPTLTVQDLEIVQIAALN